jgi:hypothetical protein
MWNLAKQLIATIAALRRWPGGMNDSVIAENAGPAICAGERLRALAIETLITRYSVDVSCDRALHVTTISLN